MEDCSPSQLIMSKSLQTAPSRSLLCLARLLWSRFGFIVFLTSIFIQQHAGSDIFKSVLCARRRASDESCTGTGCKMEHKFFCPCHSPVLAPIHALVWSRSAIKEKVNTGTFLLPFRSKNIAPNEYSLSLYVRLLKVRKH